MKAIISDIHGNIHALEVALEKIEALGIADSDILSLGDVIGYGPRPEETIKVARRFAWNLQGNHEAALLTGGVKFNPRAQAAIKWTMDQMDFETKCWITDWAEIKQDEQTEHTFVHGSPRNHTEEYVLPQRAFQADWMRPIFNMFPNVCYVGHTHVPGVFRDNFTYKHPSEFNNELDLSKEEGKVIINVGSVGQPRDESVQGCFVTLDGDKLAWHRFDYDFETVAQLIYDIPELDNQLGDRLKLGR